MSNVKLVLGKRYRIGSCGPIESKMVKIGQRSGVVESNLIRLEQALGKVGIGWKQGLVLVCVWTTTWHYGFATIIFSSLSNSPEAPSVYMRQRSGARWWEKKFGGLNALEQGMQSKHVPYRPPCLISPPLSLSFTRQPGMALAPNLLPPDWQLLQLLIGICCQSTHSRVTFVLA